MKRFAPYVKHLENAVAAGIHDPMVIEPALNGQPCAYLRSQVDAETLKHHGAFFTGHELANQLISTLTLGEKPLVLDPACGAGDLLLQIARQLPVHSSLSDTLKAWGTVLHGFDTIPEFVKATQLRLALAAIRAGARTNGMSLSTVYRLLPGIQVADGLAATAVIRRSTHIVMNPPFVRVRVNRQLGWRAGLTNAAALFVAHCLDHATRGTELRAILPEVLRTGSSYRLWREHIAEQVSSLRHTSHGVFAPWGDVNVFMLQVTTGKPESPCRWGGRKKTSTRCVGERFKVCVGPVVPHRHADEGQRWAFVHARTVPTWGEISRIGERRGFSGKLFRPPFVVVRRTSRPGDIHRAVPCVIRGKRPVAVENHLLILTPHKKTLGECRSLVRNLRDARSSKWLDERICCRHLTVGSISELPWWDTP